MQTLAVCMCGAVQLDSSLGLAYSASQALALSTTEGFRLCRCCGGARLLASRLLLRSKSFCC